MNISDPTDPDELLSKLAKDEKLSGEEIAKVIETLENWGLGLRDVSLDDLFNYIVVFRKADLRDHHSVLAKFLNVKDALTVSLVLEVLCLDWEMSAEYLGHVVSIAVGLAWDLEGDAREQALKILGEYLRSHKMPEIYNKELTLRKNELEILNLLFSILDDQTNDVFLRKSAYLAIARGVGVEWEDLPGECVLLDFDSFDPRVNTSMLEYLRKKLS